MSSVIELCVDNMFPRRKSLCLPKPTALSPPRASLIDHLRNVPLELLIYNGDLPPTCLISLPPLQDQ